MWAEQFDDLNCPFLTHDDAVPEHSTEKRVMWFVDVAALDIFPVDVYDTDMEDIVWVPEMGHRYITETVIFDTKEQAAALAYSMLSTRFRLLVEAKERIDAKVQ